MGRAPCCDKANVKRGPWSPEEDAKLKSFIDQNGTGGNWIALPHKVGLKRCGKSCRLRWLNYLRPNLKHGHFSEDEDNLIYSLYITIGSRWSLIAAQLPGRTDNDIKNYWNTKLKKRLLGNNREGDRLHHCCPPPDESCLPYGSNAFLSSALAQPSTFSKPLTSFSPEVEGKFGLFRSFRGVIGTGRETAGIVAMAESMSSLMYPPAYPGRCNLEYSDSIGLSGGLMKNF